MNESGIILREEIVEEIYRKRKEIEALKQLLSPLVEEAKSSFLEANMFYGSTKNYKVTIRNMYKCNGNFINLMEENDLSHLITKQCTNEDFKKANEILQIDPKDRTYRDIYQKQLMIKRKDM